MAQKIDSFNETLQVLFASCGDKEETVNSAIIKSLTRLASVYPNEVIEQFCIFYKNDESNKNKTNSAQLGNIIKVLEQTCVNHMKALKPELPPQLAEVMMSAMMQSADYEPAVQMGASAVLVAIGHVHLDLVLQSLIGRITATVPHFTIPHTLGTLAAVNTAAVVPFVKDILGKMLPLLGTVRQEAFGHFAVAVSEQIGDNVESDSITSIKENFVVEFTLIFDVLYNQWLHSYEAKVSETVLEALGPITRLISERKFDETLNKFVLSLLALYRKQTINSYYVSQCISYILTPSPLNPKLSLSDNVISSTNHTMFNLVILEPDYDQPQTVKNHFEVLRCFDHMAGQFPDQTVDGLLNQLKNNNERDRMRAVIILTHLTTSSQVFVEKFAPRFIVQLKVMTSMEHGLKMKKLIAKAIVGLVYRNCVNAEDFHMVDFIIKHCGVDLPNVSKGELSDLHDTCKSSLILMCNSATNVRSQLRELLLKALTVEELTPSMATVAHCLSSLLQNNSDAVEPGNPFDDQVSPDLVFVRCIAHLAEPDKVERNKNILTFLEEYSGDIHKNLKNTWSIEVQRLLKYVVKDEPNDEWHDMLLNFLVTAIDEINNPKWVEGIATVLANQIVAAKQPSMIKGVSLQYLALLTCHMTNAAAVEKLLKIIFLSLKSIPFESVEYVSKAIGIAARLYGEYILNELDAVYKDLESRRGNKILSFISSRHSKTEAEINVLKYAVIVCYGKVAAAHLDAMSLARLSDNVTNILLEVLKSNPPMDLCRASVTTLYEIGKALLPAPHHNVVLRNRWQLLNAVLEQIFNSNLDRRNVELYPIIVKASMALTKLQKGILPEERNTILRVLFNSIFGELSSFKRKYEVESDLEKNDKLAKTLNDSLVLLHDLIRELIVQSTCLSTLDDLIGLLIDWLRHENGEIRTATVLIFQVIFDTYIKNVKLNYETPSKFGQMGYLLGLISPGIADTNFPVRLATVDCIKVIIQIEYLYDGNTLSDDDECIIELTNLQNNILTNDLTMIAEYCANLGDVISDRIPHLHTMQFVESLLEGYDEQEQRCIGISAILDAFFVKKGQELYQNIERIMEAVLRTMEGVGAARGWLLQPVTSLTKYHTNAVTAVLLAQRIPLNPSVTACWRCLAQDESLAPAIVDNFLRLMSHAEMYEDPYHITDRHIAALQPLTLICALSEMLQEPAMKDTCVAKFSELFAVLYTSVACFLDAEPPAYCVPNERKKERHGIVPNREAFSLSPSRICLDAFVALLQQAECYKVKEACALCFSIEHGDSSTTLQELVPALGSALCRTCPQYLARIVTSVASYARSPLPPQRAASIALLADFLRYRCNDNPVLIETVLATLRTAWADEHPLVLSVALRGVGSLASLREPARAAALPAALAALSGAVDAQGGQKLSENVPLAAMSGLSRLLRALPSAPREILPVAQRIRPFMNTECARSRERALRLFGIISSKLKSESLVEQALSSLPCFLLHLCDSNQAVVRASKFTIKEVFKTFDAPRSNEFVQTHLLEDGRLYLDEFLTALLRSLAAEVPRSIALCLQSAVNYLNTTRDDLKPYAPLLIGKLYLELYMLRETNPEHSIVDDDVTRAARSRLLQLVRAPEPLVRQHSAVALTYLCLVTGEKGTVKDEA